MTDTNIPTPLWRRTGCLYGAIGILLFLLLVSAITTAGLVAGGAGGVGGGDRMAPFAERIVEGETRASAKIVEIALDGVILDEVEGKGLVPVEGEGKVTRLVRALRQAADDDSVKGLLLRIDSPGGGVTTSEFLHHEIGRFKARGKPVVVFMEDLCASGGVYVASAADRIWAMNTTITGSIGVIVQSFNVHAFMEEHGVKAVTVKSGAVKDLLSPFAPEREADREIIQKIVDRLYERFVQVVAEGRHKTADDVKAFADGRVFTADEAKALGLVDEIGYREDALADLKARANAADARVVRYYQKPTFSVNVTMGGLDRSAVPAALGLAPVLEEVLGRRAPRFMYLWEP